MRLDITAYSVLLAGGLGLAYWASLPVGESDPNKVSVFVVDPKAVIELSLAGGEADVMAQRREGDDKFWITYTKTGTESATERFLSGDKIKDILAALNPLEAQRSIGKIDDKQAEEFGLKEAKEKFTVKTNSGKTLTLIVGKQSYGSRNRFVRDEGDGRVLLVNGDMISDLSKANIRLFERNLLGGPIEEANRAEARVGAKSKKFDHTKKDANGSRTWSDEGEGAVANASYKSWFDKIDRLRLVSYATPEQATALEKQVPFLEVLFEREQKGTEALTFLKSPAADQTEYWVKSSYLGGWAKLAANRMEPIEKDIPTIVGN